MQLRFTTPFDQVRQTWAVLWARPRLLASRAGVAWLRERGSQLAAVVRAQRTVADSGEAVELPDLAAPPDDVALAAPWWWPGLLPAALLMLVRLTWLRDRERIYESARAFGDWLDDFVTMQGLIQGAITDDYRRLERRLEEIVAALGAHERPTLSMEPTPLLLPIAGGQWRVPLLRNLWLSVPFETVSGDRLVQLARKEILQVHASVYRELVGSLGDLLQETEDYLKSLRGYLAAETEDPERLEELYEPRATQLIERFEDEAESLRTAARARIGANVAKVFDAAEALHEQSWWRVRRRLLVLGVRKWRSRWVQAEQRFGRLGEELEDRLNEWLNERAKPALGLSQPVRIRTRSVAVDPVWLRRPDLPAQLSQVLLDRRNPALLVTPPPVLQSLASLRRHVDEGQAGSLLLVTDNMAGGFSMLGHGLSIYFRDKPYRVYRHTYTRPLDKLPDVEEPILFLENFERMVLLDEGHLPAAIGLMESLIGTERIFVVTVHYLAAELLASASPAFSRFLFEVHLSKYQFDVFRRIVETRMRVSGMKFVFDDEPQFWAQLYRVSSGLPGVGLELFLRCLRAADEQTFEVAFRLPEIGDRFDALPLDGLLALRRLYMQPFMQREHLPREQRSYVDNLVQMGIAHSRGDRFAIQPQFHGLVRDTLLVKNLG